jgi:hypothetical protein
MILLRPNDPRITRRAALQRVYLNIVISTAKPGSNSARD